MSTAGQPSAGPFPIDPTFKETIYWLCCNKRINAPPPRVSNPGPSRRSVEMLVGAAAAKAPITPRSQVASTTATPRPGASISGAASAAVPLVSVEPPPPQLSPTRSLVAETPVTPIVPPAPSPPLAGSTPSAAVPAPVAMATAADSAPKLEGAAATATAAAAPVATGGAAILARLRQQRTDTARSLATPSGAATTASRAATPQAAAPVAPAPAASTKDQPQAPVAAAPAASTPAKPAVTVLYGSQTGTCQEIARNLAAEALEKGFAASVASLNELGFAALSAERTPLVIVVCSSTGDGDPPDNAASFFTAMRRKPAPGSEPAPVAPLQGVRYTVLGLGDSNYTRFMYVPRSIKTRLAELGAAEFYACAEADEVEGVENVVEPWTEGLWAALERAVKQVAQEPLCVEAVNEPAASAATKSAPARAEPHVDAAAVAAAAAAAAKAAEEAAAKAAAEEAAAKAAAEEAAAKAAAEEAAAKEAAEEAAAKAAAEAAAKATAEEAAAKAAAEEAAAKEAAEEAAAKAAAEEAAAKEAAGEAAAKAAAEEAAAKAAAAKAAAEEAVAKAAAEEAAAKAAAEEAAAKAAAEEAAAKAAAEEAAAKAAAEEEAAAKGAADEAAADPTADAAAEEPDATRDPPAAVQAAAEPTMEQTSTAEPEAPPEAAVEATGCAEAAGDAPAAGPADAAPDTAAGAEGDSSVGGDAEGQAGDAGRSLLPDALVSVLEADAAPTAAAVGLPTIAESRVFEDEPQEGAQPADAQPDAAGDAESEADPLLTPHDSINAKDRRPDSDAGSVVDGGTAFRRAAEVVKRTHDAAEAARRRRSIEKPPSRLQAKPILVNFPKRDEQVVKRKDEKGYGMLMGLAPVGVDTKTAPALLPPRIRISWEKDEGRAKAVREREAARPTREERHKLDPAGMYSAAQPFWAHISDARYETAFWSDRKVLHLELSVRGSNMAYEPGDAIGVLPVNHPDLVANLCKRLKQSPDRVLHIHPKGAADAASDAASDAGAAEREAASPAGGRVASHLPSPASLGFLLSHCVDLTGVTRKSVLRLLAEHTHDAAEKRTLLYLSARGGKDAYAHEIVEHQPSLLDLLVRFPSCNPPLDALLDGLPPLAPRMYSVSSSRRDPARGANRLSVALSVVRFKTRYGTRLGVATTWLERLAAPFCVEGGELPQEPIWVPIFLRRAADFKPPPSLATPLIMVGPGTGVAPFRGFLQDRRATIAEQKPAPESLGEAVLFFGCRREDEDYLYQADLGGFKADGTLAALHVAFSRAKADKVYVQDLLKEQGEKVWALLQAGAHVYVCGDGVSMAKDVHAALASIAVQHGGLSEADATAFLQELSAARRYVRDVWS